MRDRCCQWDWPEGYLVSGVRSAFSSYVSYARNWGLAILCATAFRCAYFWAGRNACPTLRWRDPSECLHGILGARACAADEQTLEKVGQAFLPALNAKQRVINRWYESDGLRGCTVLSSAVRVAERVNRIGNTGEDEGCKMGDTACRQPRTLISDKKRTPAVSRRGSRSQPD